MRANMFKCHSLVLIHIFRDQIIIMHGAMHSWLSNYQCNSIQDTLYWELPMAAIRCIKQVDQR